MAVSGAAARDRSHLALVTGWGYVYWLPEMPGSTQALRLRCRCTSKHHTWSHVNNHFRILMDSLGNAAVGVLGDAVEAVRVWPDEYLGTARVGIILRNDNWDTRLDALQRVDHLREMFIDELVLEFAFEDRGDDLPAGAPDAPAANAALVYA